MQLQFLDHYRLLAVSEDVTTAELAAAYRRAIDRAPRGWRDRILAKLTGRTPVNLRQAYEELLDPKLRAAYDERLAQGRKIMSTTLH